jgi:hypothetical protein
MRCAALLSVHQTQVAMKNTTAIFFSLAIVIASIVLGKAYRDSKRAEGTISVTGMGTKDFTSDLIVWSGRFTRESKELQQAYANLEKDKQVTREYLRSKGIPDPQIVFSAVETIEKTRPLYNNGEYVGAEFEAYQLVQSIQIESKDVKTVEELSRSITELLNKGVTFYSDAPRYYYTGLADLKIEMIAKATEDGYVRAKSIAENSGGDLGDLITAKMGVFQITGQNSTEEYSWGGAYNTTDKHKTASITMRLDYGTD